MEKYEKDLPKGFTLAEVLVVLVVIGILAALTIPALLQNIQDAQYKAAWKESYADISQALNLIKQDNGGDMVALCGDSVTPYQHDCLDGKLAEKLSYIKKCNGDRPGPADTYGNCWHTVSGAYSDGSVQLLNGNGTFQINSVSGYFGLGSAGLVLNNGALLLVSYSDPSCQSSAGNPFYEDSDACGYVTVDVNGFKPPNTVGKDIFSLYVNKNKVKPVGTGSLKNTCSPSQTGQSCSAQYLMQ